MTPNELLGDNIIRYISELIQEGTTLKVDIEAVAKAELLLALEGVRLCAEGELDSSTAFFVTSKDFFADLLGKTKCQIAVFDLFLLVRDFFERVLILVNFHYYFNYFY